MKDDPLMRMVLIVCIAFLVESFLVCLGVQGCTISVVRLVVQEPEK